MVVGSIALMVPILRLWHLTWSIPLDASGDANGVNSLFKGVLAHGWYLRNPNLGAPFAQDYRSYPFGDNLHLVLVKALGLVTHDSSAVLNLVFLLTFPAVALAAWWVLRRIGVSNRVATVLSVLFTFAPYHFYRGERHLFLSAYWVIPLAGYVVFRVLSGESLRRAWPLLVISVAVAGASAYYATFMLILVLAASALRAIQRRSLRAVLPGLVIAVTLGVTMIANVAPALVYQSAHRNTASVAVRAPGETEVWSLKIADLVLPRDSHRVPALAALSERYRTTFPVPSEGGAQALGLIATIGLAWLVIVAIGGWAWSVGDTERKLASVTLVAVLVATTGGISTLVALLGFSQVRNWNRISIFVAFFALAAVGLLLDRLAVGVAGRGAGRAGMAAVLAVVLAVGLFDQTSGADVPHYRATKAEWNSDATFVAGVEHAVPRGAMVYQFPYVPFPENPPVVNMVDYDLLKGWLHSSTLRWSYGAFKGTPAADWQPNLNQFPLRLVLPALAMVGFRGVAVDRAGYSDGGRSFEGSLAAITTGPGLTSPDGRLSFFDLQPLAARIPPGTPTHAIARSALDLPAVQSGPGFDPLAGEGPGSTWRAAPRGTLKLVSPVDQVLVLRARLAGPPGTIAINFPDGSQDRPPVSPGGIDYVHQFRVKAGPSTLVLAADGPGIVDPGNGQASFFQLHDPSLAGVAFDQFVAP